MTHDLHDLLRATAPEQPELSTAERLSSVTARGRASVRRRRAAGGLAVVAAAAAVALPVAFTGDEPSPTRIATDPRPDPEPTSQAAPPEPCPQVLDPSTFPASAELAPSGVAWINVCADESDIATSLPKPFVVGEDSIRSLDSFVDTLLSLPKADPAKCAAATPAPLAWVLMVGYDDGTVAEVGGGYLACDVAELNGVPRDAVEVMSTFAEVN